MAKDKVLVVGETLEAAQLLRKRLFEAAKQPLTGEKEGEAQLVIKTKYFTVTVGVLACARAAVGECAERERVDGLVMSDLECPTSDMETLLGLFEVQPGVTLFCCEREARGIDDGTEDKLRMWSIDHDTEFVDMGLRTVSEREKEGIDRVFEALASYPWQTGFGDGAEGLEDGLPSLDAGPMSAAAASGTIPVTAKPDTSKKPASTDADEKTSKKTTEEEEDGDDDEAIQDATIQQFCDDLASGERDDEEDDVEKDGFLQLMEKLSMMRNAAQRMPDEQRKQYAEQVAMAFARQLAFDDDEEDFDPDDEEARRRRDAEDSAASKAFDDEIQRIFAQMNISSQKPPS